MKLTRKEFIALSSKAAAAATIASPLLSLATGETADDIRNSPAVRKIHDYIAREKEKHIGDKSDSAEPETSLRRETERAKERATLRHKGTGKWAKAMRRRGKMDADQVQDMAEMLDRRDKLRRKIQGSKESGDSDNDDSDDDLAQIKARAFDELAELKREDSGPAKSKCKSVFDMKFMLDAAAREQREVQQKADDLMDELQKLDAPVHGDEVDGSKLPEDDSSVIVERTGGRISLRPSGVGGFGCDCDHTLTVLLS